LALVERLLQTLTEQLEATLSLALLPQQAVVLAVHMATQLEAMVALGGLAEVEVFLNLLAEAMVVQALLVKEILAVVVQQEALKTALEAEAEQVAQVLLAMQII